MDRSQTCAKAPADNRLAELANVVSDEYAVLGPLDRQDLREAICELIERRALQAISHGSIYKNQRLIPAIPAPRRAYWRATRLLRTPTP